MAATTATTTTTTTITIIPIISITAVIQITTLPIQTTTRTPTELLIIPPGG